MGSFSVNIDLDALAANNVNTYPVPYNYSTVATMDGERVSCFIKYPYDMTILIDTTSEAVVLMLPMGLLTCGEIPLLAEYGAATFMYAIRQNFPLGLISKGVSKTLKSEVDKVEGTTIIEWL